MPSLRKSPKKRSAQKSTKIFNLQVFLAHAGIGRTVRHYRPKQTIFLQGERADAVFYIQDGKVKLSVLSKQGKEATIALVGKGDFLGEGLHRLGSTPPTGNRQCGY
jgi:CRP-like cAMP-binding protein